VKDVGRLRRLVGFGWAVLSSGGGLLALKRDDGTIVPVASRLVGTREAAELLGVRPPNFVRDWASRPDFPAPLATLSSGRIWIAAAVERYAEARRAPSPEKSGCTRSRAEPFGGRAPSGRLRAPVSSWRV
jgi:hypothetical protein